MRPVPGSPFGAASFEPLTPLTFLRRSAVVHADRVAYLYDGRAVDYATFGAECRRFAGALTTAGARPGDRIAVLAPNTPLMLQAQFAVAAAGCVLVPLNIRLAPREIAAIAEHSGATTVLADDGLLPSAADVRTAAVLPESQFAVRCAEAPEVDLEVADEFDVYSINYTSGTTGRPKGVLAHHRGAYLQALGMLVHARLVPESRYLWTLPMFHCNGWAFPWAVTAAGAGHVCMRTVDPALVWRSLRSAGITHLCAAPTVLSSLVSHPDRRRCPQPVWIATGGSPPSPALLRELDELDMHPTHLYGLTECFGPAVVNQPKPSWAGLGGDGVARVTARQGAVSVVGGRLRVVDGSGADVPADGRTVGEVLLRGNNVSLGYLDDEAATATAMAGGWLHTGDLGVLHPDGTLELTDRAKDVIVSGGENIASIEVEQVIASHPAVLECAVVAAPHPRWGERPVAFVVLRPDATAEPEEIRTHVRDRLAGFKVPDAVHYAELPKSANGKILKYRLREIVAAPEEL